MGSSHKGKPIDGYDPDDLAALLQYESEKASERGMDYVVRTVNAAM